MVLLGFFLGYKLRLLGDFIPGVYYELNLEFFPELDRFMNLALLFAVFLVLIFAAFGLYQLKNARKLWAEWAEVIWFSVIWILVVMAYFFLAREYPFSRLALGFSYVFSVLCILFGRTFLRLLERLLLSKGIGKRSVLIVGCNKLSGQIAQSLLKDPHYLVSGYIAKKSHPGMPVPFLGQLEDLDETIQHYKIEEIIQTSQNLSGLEAHELLEYCREHHLEYHFVPDIFEVERTNIEVEPIAGLPLIHLKPTPLDGWGRIYKRTLDILLSALGLIILSPFFFLIALGIKWDSRGPVFFSKLDDGSPAYRVGQGGKYFVFYKFRTMRDKTHQMRYTTLAKKNNRKGSPLVKIKNDPRITPFGRFLRRFSLDELPQLWNVLKGDMSLVGPRPHLPEEVAKYQKHHKFLLTIKPGLTGLSQVSGRSDLDFEKEVRLDSYYIKHWSPLMDFKIFVKTFFVVLRGKGAD